MIKITIPFELKKDWQNEKYLLEELENSKNGFLFKGNIEKIDKAINRNDVLFVLERINALTVCSKTGNRYIENKGFFKEYKEWLDFALKEILASKEIKIKSDDDIYETLKIVNEFLNKFPDFNILTLSVEKVAASYVHNVKNNFKINPCIEKIYYLFMDIGIGFIKPYEIADISYENFINQKEKQKIKKL